MPDVRTVPSERACLYHAALLRENISISILDALACSRPH